MSKRIIGYNLYLKPHHATYELYTQALSQPYIPVTGPTPVPTRFEGIGTLPAYMLDISRLTPRQQVKLQKAIAEQFEVTPFDVALQLHTIGMPVVARDCDPPRPVYAQ